MGTQTDLLIEARRDGNWVTRATNQALETALVGLCVEFKAGETEQIRSSDLRVVNIRSEMENVLEETCAVAEHDLPAWVQDEYEAVKSAGVNSDETGWRWSTANRLYERMVTDAGTVEWRGPRFKARPPEPREGERYDYEGHPIRPVGISLMVLREMSVKLYLDALTERLDAILKSTSAETQIDAGQSDDLTGEVVQTEPLVAPIDDDLGWIDSAMMARSLSGLHGWGSERWAKALDGNRKWASDTTFYRRAAGMRKSNSYQPVLLMARILSKYPDIKVMAANSVFNQKTSLKSWREQWSAHVEDHLVFYDKLHTDR